VSDERGFTLVELMAGVLLVGILGGMAVVTIGSALSSVHGDTAMTQVTTALRSGREAAMAQRRSVDVVFVPPNRIQLWRNDTPLIQTALGDVWLDGGAAFDLDASLPDTLDAFGNAAAVDFGAAVTIQFLPDGTLVDENSIPLNGTVFLARPGDLMSVRAVTVTGGSGRLRSFRWMGPGGWEAR
jgi:prepilin-type N-terminal cleavage/methylation domain-containing protein